GNGVPDYVEQVGAAVDVALLYYERHGFKQPLPDTAGPDSKPDIYIDTLPAGVLGFTLKQAHSEGGTFVLVSPTLDTAASKRDGDVDASVPAGSGSLEHCLSQRLAEDAMGVPRRRARFVRALLRRRLVVAVLDGSEPEGVASLPRRPRNGPGTGRFDDARGN